MHFKKWPILLSLQLKRDELNWLKNGIKSFFYANRWYLKTVFRQTQPSASSREENSQKTRKFAVFFAYFIPYLSNELFWQTKKRSSINKSHLWMIWGCLLLYQGHLFFARGIVCDSIFLKIRFFVIMRHLLVANQLKVIILY